MERYKRAQVEGGEECAPGIKSLGFLLGPGRIRPDSKMGCRDELFAEKRNFRGIVCLLV
jgi:hypothetical protein